MQEVRLIALSQPVIENIPDAEGLLGYVARVSNQKNQDNYDTVDKLLRYCLNNAHWSVFETVFMTFEIKSPRDISRQVLRHKSCSFQEFSQRYALVDKDMFIPYYREARLQDKKNRQKSIEITWMDDNAIQKKFNAMQDEVKEVSYKNYVKAINLGIAKECARVLLPEGLVLSTLYVSGSLRSFLHYCALRMGNGTQKEHQEIANKVWQVVRERFPSIRDYIK